MDVNQIKLFFAGLLFMVTIDTIFIFGIMGKFYKSQLGDLARKAAVTALPIVSALLVWTLIILGILIFVLPKANLWWHATIFGAIFGLIVYAVYDLTNLATLHNWPIVMTIMDIIWGGFICGLTSTVLFFVNKMF
ncbi:DUF2177 family protein [Candidatus Woesearchaeota archaeon]|jgi:uncharacterized membrane protein|nr:DUF2177 family protein [Candidatus Woesearchaeota archaeon]